MAYKIKRTKKRYVLKLSTGETKSVKAKSPRDARLKYYGSPHHFKTEASVDQVLKL
jgi:hypothetical protein